MERGYIKINTGESKTPAVEIQLVNNDLWLSKYEMARLFNCFPQKIEANLCSIFKDKLLWENDCTYNHRYTDKSIEKQCLYYNLETLIFVSYRINTLEAKAFRQFIHSALQERLRKKYLLPDNLKHYGLLQIEKSYCWN
jgi:hypothetical protein